MGILDFYLKADIEKLQDGKVSRISNFDIIYVSSDSSHVMDIIEIKYFVAITNKAFDSI